MSHIVEREEELREALDRYGWHADEMPEVWGPIFAAARAHLRCLERQGVNDEGTERHLRPGLVEEEP